MCVFRHYYQQEGQQGERNPLGGSGSQKGVLKSIHNFGFTLCISICKLKQLSKMEFDKAFKKAMH
jgi:hypothetical protein